MIWRQMAPLTVALASAGAVHELTGDWFAAVWIGCVAMIFLAELQQVGRL